MGELDDARKADMRFFDALLRADRAALDDVLDEQFIIVDVAAGNVTDRATFLDGVAGRAIVFTRIDVADEYLIRAAGTAAVVVGRTSMTVVLPDHTEIAAASRYTHVFVPTPTGWRLLSAQGTMINDEVGG